MSRRKGVFEIYTAAAHLATAAAERFVRLAAQAASARGRFLVALPTINACRSTSGCRQVGFNPHTAR